MSRAENRKSKRRQEREERTRLHADNKEDLLVGLLSEARIEPNTDKAKLAEQLIDRVENCLKVRSAKLELLASKPCRDQAQKIFDLEDDVIGWIKTGYKRDSKKVGFAFGSISMIVINYLINRLVKLIIDWYLRNPEQYKTTKRCNRTLLVSCLVCEGIPPRDEVCNGCGRTTWEDSRG